MALRYDNSETYDNPYTYEGLPITLVQVTPTAASWSQETPDATSWTQDIPDSASWELVD